MIYKSNRSTSKYCCKQHNSLYAANGSNVDYTILNSKDRNVSYYKELQNLYASLGDFQRWTKGCSKYEVQDEYCYKGPLPDEDEILLVSGFLIKRRYWVNRYYEYYQFKPMTLLTKPEKASCIIIKPELFVLCKDC